MDEGSTQPDNIGVKLVNKNAGIGRRNLIRLILIIILTLVLALAFFLVRRLQLPALQIGDTKISRSQFNKLSTQAKKAKFPDNKIEDTIINFEKAKIAAKAVGVVINNDTVKATALRSIKPEEKNKEPNEWQILNATQQFIDQELLSMRAEGYDGSIFYFPFSKHVLAAGMDPKSADPLFGDAKAIAEDRQYASTAANDMRQKILSKNISVDDALNKVTTDERLHYGISPNTSRSFVADKQGNSFNKDRGANEHLPSYVVDKITALKEGEVSNIEIEIQQNLEPATRKFVRNEVAFYFVVLSRKRTAETDVQGQYISKISKIKVSNNVKLFAIK